MTPEQLKQNVAAMIAFADGKPIEYRLLNEELDPWEENADPNFDFSRCEYRPKPEPRTRPWNCPEDVPDGLIYLKTNGGQKGIALEPDDAGIYVTGGYFNYLQLGFYSTDRKNWQPCVVEVSE